VPGSILAVVSGPGTAAPTPHICTAGKPGPRPGWRQRGTVASWAPKPERRAAQEPVSACHQAQLAGLLSHIGAATGRYRAGEIGADAVDETIHHYHRAAAALWTFCFARGGGTHAEFTAGLPGRMTAGAKTIDWQERATPRPTPIITTTRRSRRECPGCHRSWPLPQRLSAQSRPPSRTWRHSPRRAQI
jgi:hypothetical protein